MPERELARIEVAKEIGAKRSDETTLLSVRLGMVHGPEEDAQKNLLRRHAVRSDGG